MGMEIPVKGEEQTVVREDWPRILLVGPPHVGKRSILHRLLAMGKAKGQPIMASGIMSQGWMIETKYYTADVCISMASLIEGDARDSARVYISSNQCQALVLVLDLSNFSTFESVREWVATLDLQNLEIRLCVGNKADRLPDHFAHAEYRRRLQKRGESSSDPNPEFWDFGIQQTDGSSLLGDKEGSADNLRSLCVDWCSENGIEYLEACALDHSFDQCISIDGDTQGLNRIWGALAAHMWPGLTLKSENGLTEDQVLLGDEGSDTDEDSEISIDYERLSNGSAEPWDSDEGPWTFYETAPLSSGEQDPSTGTPSTSQQQLPADGSGLSLQQPHGETMGSSDTLTSVTEVSVARSHEVHAGQDNSTPLPIIPTSDGGSEDSEALPISEQVLENGRSHQDLESRDFEQLMMEMARMRESGRLMPDSQRREMAATLAIRMASLFDEDDM